MRRIGFVGLISSLTLFSVTIVNESIAQTDTRGLRIMQRQAGKRWAICIGINNYVDRKLNNLNKAANDAYGLSSVLEQQGDFKIAVFSDLTADGTEQSFSSTFFPTKKSIEDYLSAIAQFRDISPNDLVVFSFSGHGISDERGNGYFLPIDWDNSAPYRSAIPVSAVTSWLQRLGVSKSLILVDACREEMSTSRSVDGISRLYEQKFDSAHVSAVFYATKQAGYSYEDTQSDYGAFTRFLIEGLGGQSDKDQDGLVTFRELSIYVEDTLGDWARENGYRQRPYTRILGEQSGDLALTIISEKTIEQQPRPISEKRDDLVDDFISERLRADNYELNELILDKRNSEFLNYTDLGLERGYKPSGGIIWSKDEGYFYLPYSKGMIVKQHRYFIISSDFKEVKREIETPSWANLTKRGIILSNLKGKNFSYYVGASRRDGSRENDELQWKSSSGRKFSFRLSAAAAYAKFSCSPNGKYAILPTHPKYTIISHNTPTKRRGLLPTTRLEQPSIGLDYSADDFVSWSPNGRFIIIAGKSGIRRVDLSLKK